MGEGVWFAQPIVVGVLGWVLRLAGGRAGAMTQWGVLTASTMRAQHSATRTTTPHVVLVPYDRPARLSSRTTMYP